MSIIDSFDNTTEEVLKPCYVTKSIDDFPELVVVTFSEAVIKLVKNMRGAIQINKMNGGFTIPIYRIRYKDKNIAIYQTLIGAAGTAGLFEEVIAKGGKKFVFFGSCGTLDKEVVAGHFVVPTAAYRDEGTSYHYAPAKDYIKVETADRLAQIFDELEVPYIKTKTWTTDGLYRETKKNMMNRKNEGCLAVDMECSAIAAVSKFRNVEFYQYLYAEDTLDGVKWDSRTMGKVEESAFQVYLKTALEIAVRI